MMATACCWWPTPSLLLAVVSALQGVFRALDSGPLQAWFVDASLDGRSATSTSIAASPTPTW